MKELSTHKRHTIRRRMWEKQMKKSNWFSRIWGFDCTQLVNIDISRQLRYVDIIYLTASHICMILITHVEVVRVRRVMMGDGSVRWIPPPGLHAGEWRLLPFFCGVRCSPKFCCSWAIVIATPSWMVSMMRLYMLWIQWRQFVSTYGSWDDFEIFIWPIMDMDSLNSFFFVNWVTCGWFLRFLTPHWVSILKLRTNSIFLFWCFDAAILQLSWEIRQNSHKLQLARHLLSVINTKLV